MFLTIVLAILFVCYGIPLLIGILGAIAEFFEDNPAVGWIIAAIVFIVILCIVG